MSIYLMSVCLFVCLSVWFSVWVFLVCFLLFFFAFTLAFSLSPSLSPSLSLSLSSLFLRMMIYVGISWIYWRKSINQSINILIEKREKIENSTGSRINCAQFTFFSLFVHWIVLFRYIFMMLLPSPPPPSLSSLSPPHHHQICRIFLPNHTPFQFVPIKKRAEDCNGGEKFVDGNENEICIIRYRQWMNLFVNITKKNQLSSHTIDKRKKEKI